jgi:hypothetical protein
MDLLCFFGRGKEIGKQVSETGIASHWRTKYGLRVAKWSGVGGSWGSGGGEVRA